MIDRPGANHRQQSRGGDPTWVIHTKPLSDFASVTSLAALQAAENDCLFVFGERTSHRDSMAKYLNDIGDGPYLLSLHDPLLVPARSMNRFISGTNQPLPKVLRHRKDANLLLTGRHEFVADSITRGIHVHQAVQWLGSDCWRVPAIEKAEYIDDPCLFVDLVCRHFGHALVDTPGRLWPLLEEYGLRAEDYRFVGFGTHGLRGDPQSWPSWLEQLLEAYGVPPSRLHVLDGPTRCRRLLVPRRLAPFKTRGGTEYNRVMQRAGDRLLAAGGELESHGERLFLSRSRLANPRRSPGPVDERELDAMFSELGFSIVHTQDLSLAAQVAAVRGATHIAGCVGSQMHLTAFCDQAQLKVLRIVPSFFVTHIDARIMAPIGGDLQDYVVECEPEAGVVRHRSRWSLNSSDLETLPRVVKAWRGRAAG